MESEKKRKASGESAAYPVPSRWIQDRHTSGGNCTFARNVKGGAVLRVDLEVWNDDDTAKAVSTSQVFIPNARVEDLIMP
jgi:hypothetical protein